MDMLVHDVLPDSLANEVLQGLDLPYAIVSPSLTIEYCSVSLIELFEEKAHFIEQLKSALDHGFLGEENQIASVKNPSVSFKVQPLSNHSYLVQVSIESESSVKQELSMISQGLAELADCNLNLQLNSGNNQDYQSQAFLQTTIANLNEAIKQIHKSCTTIDSTSLKLNDQSKDLADRSTQQYEATETTSSSMQELRTTTANNSERTSHAEKISSDAVRLAEEGNRSLTEMIEAISGINDSAKEMNKIIETVDLITFQTNILSLNAAVEAAHAGEHGKGFSIVAQEVRALAKRSAASSSEIKELINSTIDACKLAKSVAETSEQVVTQMSDKITDISADLSQISIASKEQSVGIDQIAKAISDIAALAESNNTESNLLSEHTFQLRQEVEQMQDVIGIFKLNENSFSHALHKEVCDLVQQARDDIKQKIEQAIAQNEISLDHLFDRDYIAIADSNPVRYQTQFDQFTDQSIGPVQERWLEKHPSVIYLLLSDENGYVPTHNLAFSQPLTGDLETDIANNRTKRIFTDRVGQSVGRSKEPFLIQTYRRDTGELMFDLSVPLYVFDQHWGAIRAGYRLQA